MFRLLNPPGALGLPAGVMRARTALAAARGQLLVLSSAPAGGSIVLSPTVVLQFRQQLETARQSLIEAVTAQSPFQQFAGLLFDVRRQVNALITFSQTLGGTVSLVIILDLIGTLTKQIQTLDQILLMFSVGPRRI